MTTSRRRFMKLVATGSAALIAGAAPVRAQAPARRKKPAPAAAARPAAVQAEIDIQKSYVAKQLGVIRGYALPAGSEPGFTFRPLARRPRRGPSR